jgi:hypothetical protein
MKIMMKIRKIEEDLSALGTRLGIIAALKTLALIDAIIRFMEGRK